MKNPPLLSVRVDRSDAGVVVRLVGGLDLSTAPVVREALADVLEEPADLVLEPR
jgi:anti-anti-sigma regulatory factor